MSAVRANIRGILTADGTGAVVETLLYRNIQNSQKTEMARERRVIAINITTLYQRKYYIKNILPRKKASQEEDKILFH